MKLRLIEVREGRSKEIKYHPHPNGGGLVAETAFVDQGAYVGPGARVDDEARVIGKVFIKDEALVCDEAVVDGRKDVVEISGVVIVGGGWYVNKSISKGIHF